MPKLPPKARLELVQSVIFALDNELRLLIMAHLFEAGSSGLRTSELARRLDKKQDHLRKHLLVLQQALLIQNQVGRDAAGVFSRYFITDYGEEWLGTLKLKEGSRALPLMT